MKKLYTHSYTDKKVFEIYSLNKFRKNKRDHIGNKANSLLKLLNNDFNVPDSVILNYTFNELYKKNGHVPTCLLEIIQKKLGTKLAIRSSCSLEDGHGESCAGLFKTTLNVENKPADVILAIRNCYISLSEYLEKYGNGEISTAQMGVIIQSMITPKISGVIFTCPSLNPEKDENRFQIEYCYGPGDQLTSGAISGDSIILDKKTGKIIEQKGNIFISQGSLNKLWQNGKKLEEKYDFPQDVEFVISDPDNEIYFVQSRPITAFHYTPEYIIKKEKERLKKYFKTEVEQYGRAPILTSSNITELFPTAIPLGISIFKSIFIGSRSVIGAINAAKKELGYSRISKTEQEKYLFTIGNQLRTNLLIRSLNFRLKSINRKYYLNKFVPNYFDLILNEPERANYPEFGVFIQNPGLAECKSLFKEKGQYYYNLYSDFLNGVQKKIDLYDDLLPEMLKSNQYFYDNLICKKSKSLKQIDRIFKFQDDGSIAIDDHFSTFRLIKEFKKLIAYLRSDFGFNYAVIVRIAFLSSDIVKSILHKLSKKHPKLLFNIDDGELKVEKILEYFEILLANIKHEKRTKFVNHQVSINDVKLFRKNYGHRGSLDIIQPRLSEYPDDELMKIIRKENSKTNEYVNIEQDWYTNFMKKYNKLEPKLTEDSKNLRLWLDNANRYIEFREQMKFELLKYIYLSKIIVKEISNRYNLGDLIYYLKCEDLMKLKLKNIDQFRLKSLKKKAYIEACKEVKIENVIFEKNENNISLKIPQFDNSNGQYRYIKGNSIYHGSAEGFCIVSENSQEFYDKLLKRLETGGTENIIGIFKSIDPGYINLEKLTGIITQHGGHLAHAATVCREKNIPYISNIDIDRFNDGNYIIFDTSNHQVIYRE
ncbi:MAG: hypothetical protein GF353_13160 [Candidatus Lokiarchaeota archaeon]|nr:hypothetical protein [Candidatus Lokiarchaeota archaeon]